MTEPAKAAEEPRERYSTPSASALDLVGLCEARAAAKYVARKREPEGAKAALGTRCHTIAEEYLRDGKAPNLVEKATIITYGTPKIYYPGKIVERILHHLPPAGSIPDVEHQIGLKWRGIQFQGKLDWENPTRIGDHKFTTKAPILLPNSTVKVHYDDKTDLRLDMQRIIYSADKFARTELDELDMQWTYGQFDLKASKPIVIHGQRAEIAKLMDDVVIPRAEKLLRWVQDDVDWKSLPKNVNACEKFPPDGCPYSRECPRTAKERRMMVMSSDLINRLRAKKNGVALPATAAAAELPTPLTAPSNDVENDAEDAKAAIVGAINPPGEAVEEAADAPATAAPETPKRGRGRPPKSAATPEAPKTEPVGKPYVVTTKEPSAAVTGSSEPDPSTPTRKLILLIDCLPVRGMSDFTLAADLIAEAHAHVCREMDVVDYRMVDYAKGAGFLAASVAGLAADLPQDTVVMLDTRSPEGAIALHSLSLNAYLIIRGAA